MTNKDQALIQSKTRIIFDFDGTIGKLQADWSIWHAGMGDIYRKFEPEFNADRKGMRVNTFEKSFIEKYGEPCSRLINEFCLRFEQEYVTACMPHATIIDLIRSFSDKIVYVWSSNTRWTIDKYMKEFGLASLCKLSVTRDDVRYIKPSPEGFSLIYNNKSKKQDYVLIGDSTADRDAAKNVCIDFIAASSLDSSLPAELFS